LKSAIEYGGSGGLGTSNGIIDIEDKQIVCRDEVKFPESCVKTGRTENLVEVRKKLYWTPSWVWIFILINVLILAIVYFVTRKPIHVVYYIDRTNLRIKLTVGVLLFVGGLVGLAAGGMTETSLLVIGGIIALIAGLVMVALYGTTLKPVAHKDGIFRLKGFGDEFLQVVRETIS
jgi:hypothetical protein